MDTGGELISANVKFDAFGADKQFDVINILCFFGVR